MLRKHHTAQQTSMFKNIFIFLALSTLISYYHKSPEHFKYFTTSFFSSCCRKTYKCVGSGMEKRFSWVLLLLLFHLYPSSRNPDSSFPRGSNTMSECILSHTIAIFSQLVLCSVFHYQIDFVYGNNTCLLWSRCS